VKAANGAARKRRNQMKFMVSMVIDETSTEKPTPEQMHEMGAKMALFMGELNDSGVLLDDGAKLAPSATARTLRYGEDGKPVVTDGPFAESKEQIAGYMVLECKDIDEAVGWAQRLPVLGRPAVEVRPIAEPG
jgi:hypothetical protein